MSSGLENSSARSRRARRERQPTTPAPADHHRRHASLPDILRVLLVDDNPADARLVHRLLGDVKHLDFSLNTVETIEDTLEAIQRRRYDAIVMDAHLSDARGSEGLAEIQRVQPGLAVVVLSGRHDEDLALQLVAAGAQDCFVKGQVTGTQLARAIRFAIERKRAEQLLKNLAKHDPLTGLANRSMYEDRLELAIARARRRAGRFALLFIDLDHFKCINDRHGHEAGDLLLCAVAERFKGVVRECDTVARLGGDEFAMVLEDLADAHSVDRVADSVLAQMRSPFEAGKHRFTVGASIGIAMYPDHGDGPTELTRSADSAMYLAKQAGRNRYRFKD